MRRLVPFLDITNDIRQQPTLRLIDIQYIKEKDTSIVKWIRRTCSIIRESLEYLQAIMVWIPADHFPPIVHGVCLDIVPDTLDETWIVTKTIHQAVGTVDSISAKRYMICIKHDTSQCDTPEVTNEIGHDNNVGYSQCLSNESHDAPDTRLILQHDINLEGDADHDLSIPRTVAMMSSSSTNDKAEISYADLILDPAFPGQEPVSEDQRNTMLGR